MLFGKIAEGSSTEGRTYSVWLNDDGYMHLTSSSDEEGQTSMNTSNGSIGLGNWYHYTGVIDRNQGELRSYIDGERKVSTSVDTNDTVSHNDPLRIGFDAYSGNSSYSPLNGRLDDIRLYNKPLSDEEVSNLYNTGSIED